jgi:aspartyl-tRNA(Asn)/glutamyl-tRNA(Gln) amidotransferase subunit B
LAGKWSIFADPKMEDQDQYEVVVGLEVHAQLLTRSKLFCGDSIAYGAEPNTQVSPITLAHPELCRR